MDFSFTEEQETIAKVARQLVEHRATESFALSDTEWNEPWNDAD